MASGPSMKEPAAEPAGAGAAAASADAADGGWTSESHSALEAVSDIPIDTTAQKSGVATAASVASVDGDAADDDAIASGDVHDDGADSTAQAETTAAAKTAAKPKKGTIERRQAALTKEINTLTHTRATTAKEVEDNQRELVRLRGERAALEADIAAKKPPVAGAKAVPTAAVPGAAPVRPKMADFDDLTKFDEALGQWETDLTAYQATREQALRDDITKGVDSRLGTEAQERDRQAHYERLGEKLKTGKAARPDWDATATAFKAVDLRSSWHDPTKHGNPTPFLSDVTQHAEDPAEVLYWTMKLATEDPDRAQRVADLLPTKELRDAVIMAPSPVALLEHFSTEEGAAEFEHLKGMHPVRLYQAVGALSATLLAASSGPAGATPPPITQAHPSAKPPAGTPRARDAGTATPNAPFVFEKWMAEEDAKEAAARKSAVG